MVQYLRAEGGRNPVLGSARILVKTVQTLTETLERILPKIDPTTPHEAKIIESIQTSLKQLTLQAINVILDYESKGFGLCNLVCCYFSDNRRDYKI